MIAISASLMLLYPFPTFDVEIERLKSDFLERVGGIRTSPRRLKPPRGIHIRPILRAQLREMG